VQTLLDALPVSLPIFLVLFVSVALGALVQGTIGFGLNVIVAPVAAILQPDALPAAMIVMSLPMTAGSAFRERAHIDREGVVFATLGRLPGVVLGGLVVSRLEPEALARWIGGVVVIASLMSLSSARIPITALSTALVGSLAGLMGTTSSIGGPPLALLYQRQPGPVVRSTLGAAFLIGSSLSLTALALANRVHAWHWTLGLALTPAVAIGLVLSRGLHVHVDAGWLRPAIVALASLAGLAVMLRGLA
jgi:uncharacterized protein